MGLPEESEWPKEVTLPWSSFKKTPKQPLEKIIPDLDPTAKDLLEVRIFFNPLQCLGCALECGHPSLEVH